MRKLTPELLDHLPHDDPGAIRSRRDLRRINRFMGNDGWFLRNLPKNPSRITELGAGDGHLLTQLSRKYPSAEITAYDLAPPPPQLPENITWKRGDAFAQPPTNPGGVLIANLFLHHFTDDHLHELAPWLTSFDHLLFSEPLRARIPLILGKLARPFIHPITRHDMRVSIEAGFVPNELPHLLGIEREGFAFRETTTLPGALRLAARKRQPL